MVDGWTDTIRFEKLISFEIDQLLSILSEETIEVPDLTKKDIAEIIYGWADTIEQKQEAEALMLQFLKGLKTSISETGYNIKYL